MSTTLSTFDIREHIDRLTPSKKGKNYYECPVCQGSSLSIDPKSGKFKCWSGDCESASIREAIRPWSEVRGGAIPSYRPAPKKASRQQPKPKVAPIPANLRLLQLAEPAWDCPAPEPIDDELWKIVRGEKKVSGKSRSALTQTAYCYGNGKKVYRIEWPDETNPKGHDKTYRQSHVDNDGKRNWKKGDGFWPAYRINEVVEILEDVDVNEAIAVLGLEGEQNVELARSHGIVSLTFQGSNWTEAQVVAIVEALRATGKNVTLVILRDNDATGIKKAELIKSVCDRLQFPCIVIDPVAIYPDIPDKGDIKEILDAMDADEFIRRLEAQIHASAGVADTDNDWDDLIGDTEEKKSKIPSSDAMARQIAEDYRDKLAFNNEVLCWYRYEADAPGIWSPETDEFIESIVYQIIESKGIINIPPGYIGATVRFLRCKLIERKWQPKTGLLPFQNGALEIATGKLYPHSPGYKFTWALPRPHSIVATDWGNISQWLDTATGGNLHIKNLLLAYAAATLKGRADIQKFLHLIGIGGSGKGTFCRLLIALIGLENTHSTTLDDWCGNRFEAAQAYGKRLLIFPDEDKGTRSLGKFKQLTGGDWLRAEEKGKKPFKFKFEGMVVVASNFPIFGADNSSGMSRRTIAVPFDAVVARNARRNLDNDFEPELPAFTNYLLSLDDAWVANTLRGVMDIPEISAQFWESKIREDSIAGFLNDKLILDPLAQVSIGDSPSAEGSLYWAYHKYCDDQGHKPQAIKNFSPNLIECANTILGWQIEKAHTKVGKIIKGLRLRTKADEHLPTYDYELQLRCKAGDGSGDGSVTGQVTGQNLCPEPITAPVTDKPYTQVEKNTQYNSNNNQIEIEQSPVFSSEEIANVKGEVSVNPSPELKPLPVADCDPSPDPSPHPSPAAQSIALRAPEPETPSTAAPESIAPPEPDPELVNRGVAALRKAIAENDAVAVREAAKKSIKLDSTGHLKAAIKKLLSDEENEACRILANANRKQSQPQPEAEVEPARPTDNSQEPETAEPAPKPTEPEVTEDVE
ncbi:phage/plasmid primase, P4 family [Microcoleus sp. T3_A4]|uniref:phage/plasmid primase, P4 family n=1 Tax=Microcoleus sp. T3_A4 TaxID=2818968 RepID=UPI002FD4288B